MIDAQALSGVLSRALPAQRWFSGGQVGELELEHVEVLREGLPGLVHVLARADGACYQLVLGLRAAGDERRFLEGKERSHYGEMTLDGADVVVYDGLVDPEAALAFLARMAPDEHVERARALTVEQSNSSVVYDERLILKLFRRVHQGPNPDAEVTEGLARVGFQHISAPVADWRRDDTHLAVVRQFLQGGSEGWQLALTSLRDLYASRTAPEEAGGTFAPEARRLGQVTGEMHVAMAEAFGRRPAEPGRWADELAVDLERVPAAGAEGLDREAVARAFERLRRLQDAGAGIRLHGDYHLGQTMRTDTGWYVLDFEGEPARPLEERSRPSSPLRDVAGMLRSFQYASRVALIEQGGDDDPELVDLARAWERLNREAFLDGYHRAPGVEALLPEAEASRAAVLTAFELGKAVYEVGYELAMRPGWARIPLEAAQRLLEEA